MSLIGGYFYKNGKMSTEIARRKTESFSIVPGDSHESYETLIFEGAFGHIVGKFKKNAPTQIRYKINDKFVIITLGFHDLSYPPQHDREENKTQQPGLSVESAAQQLADSEGEFVSLLLDRVSGDIHIINDRFSTRPFYIFQSSDGFVFSSNLVFLIHLTGQKQNTDPLGLLQLFSYSHTLGTTTNLKDVKRLPPASHVVISKDGISEKRYWRLRHEVAEGLEPTAFAEEVFQALQSSAATRARMFDKGFTSLSGGLDSRIVAAAIPKDANFFAFTFVDSLTSADTAEVRVAREVARLLQMEHRIKELSSTEVSNVADCLIKLTGGLQPIHHPAKVMQAVKLMTETTGFKMGGGPGDVLAGSYVRSIHNLNPKRTEELVRRFCIRRKRFPIQILARLFRKDLLAQYYPSLDESMLECFRQLSGPTATHQITAWAMVFRQPAFTFTSPIHNHPDVTEASPHLGYKYSDLMLKLPASWIYNKNFYKFMIYHCLPDLRDVIYANTGEKLPRQMCDYRISLRKQISAEIEKRLPRCLLAGLKKSQSKPEPKPSFVYNLLKGDEKLFSELNEIIHSSAELKEFFNVGDCEQFLKDFQAGKLVCSGYANEAELMGSLATVCYWFKNIYGGP